jgi:hypothetical protein
VEDEAIIAAIESPAPPSGTVTAAQVLEAAYGPPLGSIPGGEIPKTTIWGETYQVPIHGFGTARPSIFANPGLAHGTVIDVKTVGGDGRLVKIAEATVHASGVSPYDANRVALIALLENADAFQALKLHSRLRTLPFDARTPGGFDWATRIGPSALNPAIWLFAAPAPAGVTPVRPHDVAHRLWVEDLNWEGIVQLWPWLTIDDVAATVLWAKETGFWPGGMEVAS